MSLQVCGTAQYIDDIKLPPGSLHCALVLSTRPHARILGIDAAAAAAMPGVHGIYTGAVCGAGRHGLLVGGAGWEACVAAARACCAEPCSLRCSLPIPSLLPPPIPCPDVPC